MDEPLTQTSPQQTSQPSLQNNLSIWLAGLLRPVRDFRLIYLPLVMVFFAYGAQAIIDVTRDLWIKENLTWSPAELAGIGVWLNLPWTVKMVFGELVDSVPIFGSQRRAYVVVGAVLMACGMLILAGAAGGWLIFARADHLYILGAMLIVIGTVSTSSPNTIFTVHGSTSHTAMAASWEGVSDRLSLIQRSRVTSIRPSAP